MIQAAVNIAVDDVVRSSSWYQRLLGCSSPMSPENEHREFFDLLQNADGYVVTVSAGSN